MSKPYLGTLIAIGMGGNLCFAGPNPVLDIPLLSERPEIEFPTEDGRGVPYVIHCFIAPYDIEGRAGVLENVDMYLDENPTAYHRSRIQTWFGDADGTVLPDNSTSWFMGVRASQGETMWILIEADWRERPILSFGRAEPNGGVGLYAQANYCIPARASELGWEPVRQDISTSDPDAVGVFLAPQLTVGSMGALMAHPVFSFYNEASSQLELSTSFCREDGFCDYYLMPSGTFSSSRWGHGVYWAHMGSSASYHDFDTPAPSVTEDLSIHYMAEGAANLYNDSPTTQTLTILPQAGAYQLLYSITPVGESHPVSPMIDYPAQAYELNLPREWFIANRALFGSQLEGIELMDNLRRAVEFNKDGIIDCSDVLLLTRGGVQ